MSTHKKYPNYMADQRAFFDEIITNEWGLYQDPAWDRVRKFEVSKILDRVSPTRILDVGCGVGYRNVLMAQQQSVLSVVGIDYSSKSIEVANNKYPHPKVARFVSDLAEFACDEKFDLVMSSQVIEHVPDALGFLSHCSRLTVSGGRVAVGTPNRLRLMNRVRALLLQPMILEDPQHYCEYTIPELKKLGEHVGLVFESSFSYGMYMRIPFTKIKVFPDFLSNWLGGVFPRLANRYFVFFRKN